MAGGRAAGGGVAGAAGVAAGRRRAGGPALVPGGLPAGAVRGVGGPRPGGAGKLAGWGEQVFGSVFGAGPARDAYQRARDRGLEVVFRSADPGLLGLPWELMRDGAGPVALGAGGISRSLPVAGRRGDAGGAGRAAAGADGDLPPGRDRRRGYQMVARPLLERLEAVRGEVDLTVLRPPTFDALRQAVRQAADAGEPFHVVHFDGHGAMPGRAGGRRAGRRAARR